MTSTCTTVIIYNRRMWGKHEQVLVQNMGVFECTRMLAYEEVTCIVYFWAAFIGQCIRVYVTADESYVAFL